MEALYNFDEVIDRKNSDSLKYDGQFNYFGTNDIIPLWVADMDFKTPDFIIKAMKKRMDHEIFGYFFRNERFATSIVEWMRKRHQWEIATLHVRFAPGVVPALSLLVLALTNPGDKIIIQPPVYYPFYWVVKNNNRIMVENPLQLENGRYRMDIDHLKKVADNDTPKMLILCNPHNPTGNVWTKDELEELASICLEKKILILSDEIHADLIFKPHKHIPVASLSNEISANTITTIAASKTFNIAGLSTAAVISLNENLLKKYEQTLNTIHVGMGNPFGAVALEAAYTYGENWLEQLLDYLDQNRCFIDTYLKKHIPSIKMTMPEATYLAWIDFRELGIDDTKIKEMMVREAGLGLSHGPIFGTGGEGFQRLNFGCPRTVLAESLERMQNAIKKI